MKFLCFLVLNFITCVFLFPSYSVAQGHITHLDDYDEKPVHYGFVLGLNQSWFNMKTSDAYANSNFIAKTKFSTGFAVGLSVSLQPTEFLAIRISPTAVFGQRIITFQDRTTNATTEKVVESTIGEIPIMFKIKSQRRHNGRMFMLLGIKPSFSLATKAAQETERIRVKTADFAIEYGFGFEKFNEMFKFAPEIRFSHGLGNVLVPDANQFSSQISRLVNHSVSFYLFFE